MENMPTISDGVIKYLESIYPDKCPEPDWTERAIWLRRGEVGVVRHLRRLHDEQSQNILSGDLNVLRK